MPVDLGSATRRRGMAGANVGARGFTLVELIVTLLVLAILATMAAPSFQQFIAGQRVRNAASDLASAFTLMRSEAVKRNGIATLAANGTWSAGWVVTAGAERLRAYGPYTDITVSTAGGNSLWVGNDGRPGNGSQTFQVSMGGTGTSNVVCIQINGTGRVATVSGACS
ncbi:type IV fimbrial biogenesis protein FimT [Ralstonia sp. 25mfcol4.1]|nr:type IV fimbrial biogenesis protein FimT [Ralstonia sp. 25mfcol4.1]